MRQLVPEKIGEHFRLKLMRGEDEPETHHPQEHRRCKPFASGKAHLLFYPHRSLYGGQDSLHVCVCIQSLQAASPQAPYKPLIGNQLPDEKKSRSCQPDFKKHSGDPKRFLPRNPLWPGLHRLSALSALCLRRQCRPRHPSYSSYAGRSCPAGVPILWSLGFLLPFPLPDYLLRLCKNSVHQSPVRGKWNQKAQSRHQPDIILPAPAEFFPVQRLQKLQKQENQRAGQGKRQKRFHKCTHPCSSQYFSISFSSSAESRSSCRSVDTSPRTFPPKIRSRKWFVCTA